MKMAVNGVVCDSQDAVISAFDHGFLYGMGLFETLRTYGGRCFLLEKHLTRLEQSCVEIGIQWVPNQQDIEHQIEQLLQINHLKDAYIRISVSAGEEELGLPNDLYHHPNTIIYMKPLFAVNPSLDHIGKTLQLLKIKRNTPEGEIRLKSFHYLNNILAKQELARYPWVTNRSEGLFLNANGYVAEGIVSNVFFVKNKFLFTPDIRTGSLPGITRSLVMDISRKSGIPLEQGFYTWDDLLQADEIFITNSIQEIVPIFLLVNSEGLESKVNTGLVGEITEQILLAYRTQTGGH